MLGHNRGRVGRMITETLEFKECPICSAQSGAPLCTIKMEGDEQIVYTCAICGRDLVVKVKSEIGEVITKIVYPCSSCEHRITATEIMYRKANPQDPWK